jgi:hypothetical protein
MAEVLAVQEATARMARRLRWAWRRPKQAESSKFGNTLSSIIRERRGQRRINQAF